MFRFEVVNRRQKTILVLLGLVAILVYAATALGKGEQSASLSFEKTPSPEQAKAFLDSPIESVSKQEIGSEGKAFDELVQKLDAYEKKVLETEASSSIEKKESKEFLRQSEEIKTLRAKVSRLEAEQKQQQVKVLRAQKIDDHEQNQEQELLKRQHEKLVTKIVEQRRRSRELEKKLEKKIIMEKSTREEFARLKQELALEKTRTSVREQRKDEITALEKRLLDIRAELEKAKKMARLLREDLKKKATIEEDNSYLRKELSGTRALIKDLRTQVTGEQQLQSDLSKGTKLIRSLTDENNELEIAVSKLRAERDILKKEASSSTGKYQSTRSELSLKQEELIGVKKELLATREAMAELRQSQESSEQLSSRVAELEKKLIQAQNKLMLQETEKVSSVGTTPQSRSISAARAPVSRSQRMPAPRRVEPREQRRYQTALDSDVMIVEVKSAKVNLRSGPGTEHSPVMQVRRGTRLTVENRVGDWFLVFAPNGKRAYVRSDVVTGFERSRINPVATDSSARSRPLSKNLPGMNNVFVPVEGTPSEMQAFEYLKNTFSERSVD